MHFADGGNAMQLTFPIYSYKLCANAHCLWFINANEPVFLAKYCKSLASFLARTEWKGHPFKTALHATQYSTLDSAIMKALLLLAI